MRLIVRRIAGFTLIELIVVIGILALVATVGFVLYRDYTRKQTVVQAGRSVQTVLVRTRQRALSGERPDGCSGTLGGYRFSCMTGTGNYSVSALCDSSSPTVESGNLPSQVVFSSCVSFTFNVLGSGTDLASDETVSLSGFAGAETESFVVQRSGVIQ